MMRVRRRWLGVLPAAVLLAAGLLPLGPVALAQEANNWAAGPNAVGDNTYAGFIESPTPGATLSTRTAFDVSGWVVDRTAQGWAGIDEVHVYDGVADGSGTFLGKALIAQDRPDVARATTYPYWAASGFTLRVPAGQIKGGQRTLTVYAHTAAKGWWSKQVSVNVQDRPQYGEDPLIVVNTPSSEERIKTDSNYTITGYALDRNAAASQGTGVDSVEIYLDYGRGDERANLLGVADYGLNNGSGGDYGSQFAPAGFSLTFSPTKYSSDHHQLLVYAHSRVTNTWTNISVGFNIYD